MGVREILEKTMGTGELVTIIYNGGTQPGTSRRISPIGIEGDKVRAYCYTSQKTKLYRIDEIAIAGDEGVERAYIDVKNVQEPVNLPVAIHPLLEELTNLGWHVKVDNEEAGLYGFFKNGKIKKTPDVFVTFTEYDLRFGEGDGEEGQKIRRTRPWYVGSRVAAQRAKTFSSLTLAMQQFVAYGREAGTRLELGGKPE